MAQGLLHGFMVIFSFFTVVVVEAKYVNFNTRGSWTPSSCILVLSNVPRFQSLALYKFY